MNLLFSLIWSVNFGSIIIRSRLWLEYVLAFKLSNKFSWSNSYNSTFKDKWEKLNLKEVKDLDTNKFNGELLLDIIPIRSKET